MALLRPLAGSLRRSMLAGPLRTAAFHTTTSRFNGSIVNIQDSDDFTERVVKSATPVIVDFHASWCGPCKILGPRLEALVAANEGRVIMAKVDIDENSDLAVDHGVEAVPTVLAMKAGVIVDKFVGVKDTDQLDAFVKKLIGE